MTETDGTHRTLDEIRRRREALQALTCPELQAYLSREWDGLSELRRAHIVEIMVDKRCEGAEAYLLQQLSSRLPYARRLALAGLAYLDCRRHRALFLRYHRDDPDQDVRDGALFFLSSVFAGASDTEILRLALAALDDPSAGVHTRVLAASAVWLQVGTPPGMEDPPTWRDDEEETLRHPALVWAVDHARRLVLGDACEGDTCR